MAAFKIAITCATPPNEASRERLRGMCRMYGGGARETELVEVDCVVHLGKHAHRRAAKTATTTPTKKLRRVSPAASLRKIGFGEGRVRPAGLAAIESAKADGRWAAAYDSQSRASVPSDLQRALDSNAEAQSFFETLDSHNRYAILYRVHDARSPETRAKRIAAYVQMLAEGETLHPRKKNRD